jgi:hypothetical protein
VYAPQRQRSFTGGICKWWYVPVQWIAFMPPIDPLTQAYEQEPALLPGYSWLGPIWVPDSKLGFSESKEEDKPGPWYKQQVAAYQPGDGLQNRILRQNMGYMDFVVVAKPRTGSYYLVLGTPDSGMGYDHGYNTGKGGNTATAGADFTLSGESPHNATTLPVFSGDVQALSIPNTIYWGTVPTRRLPTTVEIGAGASATFPNGADVQADFRTTTGPQWLWVAEYYGQPYKRYWSANALSNGRIGGPGSLQVWVQQGTVARTSGGMWRVYATTFRTAFPNDLLTLSIS